jgi:hypothetical protein
MKNSQEEEKGASQMPVSNQQSQPRRRQRGSASVEGALVMLPFLALVMSIINLGLNFFLVDALQDRANMAARYVALNPSDVQGATNMLLYGMADQPADADVLTPPPSFMDLTASNISVQHLDVGRPTERVVLTINDAKLPVFVPGVKQTIFSQPTSATVPVEVP